MRDFKWWSGGSGGGGGRGVGGDCGDGEVIIKIRLLSGLCGPPGPPPWSAPESIWGKLCFPCGVALLGEFNLYFSVVFC